MNKINYDLGYIYPFGLRYLALGFYFIVILFRILFYNHIQDYVYDCLLSPFSLIPFVVSICIATYKNGFEFDKENFKIKKYWYCLGVQFGEWKPIQQYDYLFISKERQYYSTGGGDTPSYSGDVVTYFLYGVKGKTGVLIHQNYFFESCYGLALIFRAVVVELKIIDATGREEIEC